MLWLTWIYCSRIQPEEAYRMPRLWAGFASAWFHHQIVNTASPCQERSVSLTFATLPRLSQRSLLPSRHLAVGCWILSWRRHWIWTMWSFSFFLWHAEYPLHVNFWNRQEVEGQANNYKGWFIKNNWHSLTTLSLERNVFSNWLGCYACRWLRCSGQSKSQYKSTQHQAVSDHFSYFCCAVGKLDLNSSF